jgi:hypothetical protein
MDARRDKDDKAVQQAKHLSLSLDMPLCEPFKKTSGSVLHQDIKIGGVREPGKTR